MSSSEIRVQVDKNFMTQLKARLGIQSNAELTQEALRLLDWASTEIAAGRLVLSAKPDGDDAHQLVTPRLSRIAP